MMKHSTYEGPLNKKKGTIKSMRMYLYLLVVVLALNLCALQFSTIYEARATGDAGELVIRHQAFLLTNTSSPAVWVFVEVYNNFTVPVIKVNFTVTFFDQQNNTIEALNITTAQQVILEHRHGAAAAYLTGQEKCQRYARYEVKLDSYDWYADGEDTTLLLTEPSADLTANNVTVEGYIYNNGSRPITLINVVAFFHDENGFITYESDQIVLPPQQPLNPGGCTRDINEPFIIFSPFVNNASKTLYCLVTAETPAVAGKKGCTLDMEALMPIKGGPQTDNGNGNAGSTNPATIALYAIIGLVAAALLIVVVRQKRRRPHGAKSIHEGRTVRFMKATDFYFLSTQYILAR
jgi:hypothetical protein